MIYQVNLLKEDIKRTKLDAVAREMLTTFMKHEFRSEYFTTQQVSEMLDESLTHSVNLSGWERVRTLERNNKGKSGMFPARSSVSEEQKNFEEGCDEIFGSELSSDLQVVTLNPQMLLEELLSNSVAKDYGRTREQIESGDLPTPISIDGMIDGAKATEHKGNHKIFISNVLI